MRFSNCSQFNNSSRDAKRFAPCSCTASNTENTENSVNISGIAWAVSVLLCALFVLAGNGLGIGIIIILNIIIILINHFGTEKQ